MRRELVGHRAALLLFILGSLRQGMPALALAVIGGLLLYTGYYVRPGDLPLLLGAAALLSSYFLGRRSTLYLAGEGGGVSKRPLPDSGRTNSR